MLAYRPKRSSRAGAHAAEPARVDRDQHVEMLILAEFTRHQRAGARGRLPVDARQTDRPGT